VEYIYNTQESNKAMAEFMQAQWKQNMASPFPCEIWNGRPFWMLAPNWSTRVFTQRLGTDYMDPFTFSACSALAAKWHWMAARST
jgi:hypothetical protein